MIDLTGQIPLPVNEASFTSSFSIAEENEGDTSAVRMHTRAHTHSYRYRYINLYVRVVKL